MEAKRRAGTAGFTLIELMVVVAIITVIGAIAARAWTRGRRGEGGAAFARTALAVLHQARQISLATGGQTRIRLVPGSVASQVVLERADQTTTSSTTTTWLSVSTDNMPQDVQLCTSTGMYPAALGALSPTPTCPASAEIRIVYNNGAVKVTDSSDTVQCASPCSVALPFQTIDGKHQYKLYIYGLTGDPRLMDVW